MPVLRSTKDTAQAPRRQTRRYRRKGVEAASGAQAPEPPVQLPPMFVNPAVPCPRTPNYYVPPVAAHPSSPVIGSPALTRPGTPTIDTEQFPALFETIRKFGTNATTNVNDFWNTHRKRVFNKFLRDMKTAAEEQRRRREEGEGRVEEVPSSEEGDTAPGMGTLHAGSLETEQPRTYSAAAANGGVSDSTSIGSSQTNGSAAAKKDTQPAKLSSVGGFERAKRTFKPAQVAPGPSGMYSPPKYFPGAFETHLPKEPTGTPFVAHISMKINNKNSEMNNKKKDEKATNPGISFSLPEVEKVVNTLYFSVAESEELSEDTREFLNVPDDQSEDEDDAELRAAIEASICEAYARKKANRAHTVNCSAGAIVIDDSETEEIVSTPVSKKGKRVNPAEKGPKYDELRFLSEFACTGKTPAREKRKEKKDKREKNKHTFSQGSSMIPEGGFMHAATHTSTPPPPPSPPSSSSSSDTDETSSLSSSDKSSGSSVHTTM